MKLYLLTRPDEQSAEYEEFIGAVVAADTAEEARRIHPGEADGTTHARYWITPDKVIVKLIGQADPSIPRGVVLDSFNAG